MSDEIHGRGKQIAELAYGNPLTCNGCSQSILKSEDAKNDFVENKVYHLRCYKSVVRGRLIQINSTLEFLRSQEPGTLQPEVFVEVKKMLLRERTGLMKIFE